MKLMVTHHRCITAYRPSSNGPIERFFRTLKSLLRKYIKALGSQNWDDYLPYLQLAYHNTEHRITGYTPFFLMHGYEVRLPIDAVMGTGPNDYQCLTEYRNHLVKVLGVARRNALDRMQDQQQRQVRSTRLPVYVAGDWVYLSTVKPHVHEPKVEHEPWSGPYLVKRRVDPLSQVYVLDLQGKEYLAHAERLKAWTTSKTGLTAWGKALKSDPVVGGEQDSDEDDAVMHAVPGGVREVQVGDEFDVKAVLDYKVVTQRSRTAPRVVYYLLKWRGYLDEDNSWEPEANIVDCHELLEQFWKARGTTWAAMKSRGRL